MADRRQCNVVRRGLTWFRLGVLLVTAAGLGTVSRGEAGDWPQILGPNRNGISPEEERITLKWPAGGPNVLWERPVGSGFAGVAVVGRNGVLFHRQGDQEIVEGFDVATGKTAWTDTSPTTFRPQVGDGDGPLCVPTIVGDRVVTFGPQGLLTCLDLTTGKRHWQRRTHLEYRALEGFFGAGSSPLVIDDVVVVNVGGNKAGAGVVGFSLHSGEPQWTSTSESASYSAPVEVLVLGQRLVLMATRYQCLLLDPQTGGVYFQLPFGQRGPTVNAATPVVSGDHFLITSSYGIGSVYARFDLLGVYPEWRGDSSLATQYCTPILKDGFLYAIDGRDDIPPADLKCVELATGKVRWAEQNFGYGTLILAGGRLIAVKTDGEIVLIDPQPSACRILSRAQVLRGTVRALPALSDGRLYLRDERVLKCLDLRAGL